MARGYHNDLPLSSKPLWGLLKSGALQCTATLRFAYLQRTTNFNIILTSGTRYDAFSGFIAAMSCREGTTARCFVKYCTTTHKLDRYGSINTRIFILALRIV